MNMQDIIYKKREGRALTQEEIRWFVAGYTAGDIPDYQASALLMAICLQGMDRPETWALTAAMRESGDVEDLSAIPGIKVDKHSTGGVGDKTTFIVAPLAAACGVPVAKMSGRGLGFTGGTVDKLESIPGFRTELSGGEFVELVNRIGISLIGQTGQIAPADKKIYALRDVTATVDNLSLITSSIMSKKLASGSDAIVLDVKWGKGAFMTEEKDAVALAELMTDIGRDSGKKMAALVTDMNQPLGQAVGNSLEVIEAIETLKGQGPSDITDLSMALASYMIFLGGKAPSPEEGLYMAMKALKSGKALEKLRQLIEGQQGDPRVLEDYSLFPQAAVSLEVCAPSTGCVTAIDARAIGIASRHTGAGREKKGEPLDLSAGLILRKKEGEKVLAGEPLATVYSSHQAKAEGAAEEVLKAYTLGPQAPKPAPLIKKIIV